MHTVLTSSSLLDRLRSSGQFATVDVVGEQIRCRARDVESEAHYVLSSTDRGLVVGFETPDRWLSESVEADLYHASDSLDELLEASESEGRGTTLPEPDRRRIFAIPDAEQPDDSTFFDEPLLPQPVPGIEPAVGVDDPEADDA